MVEWRLYRSSESCKKLLPFQTTKKPRCNKTWKGWQCSSSNSWIILSTLVSHARGFAACEGKHRAILTAAMKKYISDMDETGLPPRHIWSGLRRYSAAPPINGVPTHKQEARCVRHLRLNHGDRNSVESLKALVHEFPRCSGIDTEKAFIFGSTIDDEGCDDYKSFGKDENATIRNMFSSFHIDATFKLSEIGYPVITCGFGDLSRNYNLAVIFIVSRLTHSERAAVLSSLLQVCEKLLFLSPNIDAGLGDAENTQCIVLQSTS
ncbi:hypothetical protein PHMEG_0008931 [Phytophthora megakarya]|uniref:MULE transposase domain-containing protein n=1 Tax=Phytophthora megakarya TaxID=4795 RepID=A0A225WHE9_9STRA|nr:hypothetical protein PHMEG_0008931 [Phytophthora megakarya]